MDDCVGSDHPAHEVLAELGGLQIIRGGIVELDFQHVPDIDRLIEPWAEALQTRLIGIAEAHNAHGVLYMTGVGHVIGVSMIHPACWFEGRTIGEALSRVLNGERSRPMLLPGEAEVKLYGDIFRHGDSEVITPNSPELRP